MAASEEAGNTADPYDISHDEEFIKEETIRKGYVRRSARTAQKKFSVG